MNARWRVINTGALDPFANMALDEAILRGYERHSSPPTLRIYGWKYPSLTFGYSQNPARDLDIEFCRKRSMPFVRRITGGGIILHGKELTYSLVCSKDDLGIPARVVSSYKIICSFLISFYKKLGIKAEFACDDPKYESPEELSTLCFAAKEKYDIVASGRKIGGNAQKRSQGVIFQHGSIPFRFETETASSFLRSKAPGAGEYRATCLEDMLGPYISAPELSRTFTKAFAESFKVETEALRLSDTEEAIFRKLKTLKYESVDWNYNRVDMSEHKDHREWKEVSCGPGGSIRR